MSDFYKTLKGVSQGIYKEKMSKFIAIAQPAQSADEAKALIKQMSTYRATMASPVALRENPSLGKSIPLGSPTW